MDNILLRKTTYSDSSTKWTMCVKLPAGDTREVRITSKQFKEFKKMGCFQVAETDFSKKTPA